MKRRRIGTILVIGSLLVLAYSAAVITWRDPVTDLYNRYQQNRLESALEAEIAEWDARPVDDMVVETDASPTARTAASRAATARAARRFLDGLELGQAFGRLEINRIDLDAVVVHGTRWGADLSRGPGHYEQTTVPGLGRTVGEPATGRRSERPSGTSTTSASETRSSSSCRTPVSATACSTTRS